MKTSKKFKKDLLIIQDKLVMKVSKYKANTKSGFQLKMEWFLDTEKNAKIFDNLRKIDSDFDKMMSFMIHKYADLVLEKMGEDWIGETSIRVLLQEMREGDDVEKELEVA